MLLPKMLTVSPFLLLIVGAVVVRFMYLRGYRNAWLLALIISLLAWGILLPLGVLPTTQLDFSIKSGSFPLQFAFEFQLDEASWRMALAALTVLNGVLFLELSRGAETRGVEQQFLMIFGALTGLSMLSASLLSLILTWTALDVALMIYLARRSGAAELAGISKGGLAIVLVRTGLLMGALAAGSGTRPTTSPFGEIHSPLGWGFLVAGLSLRAIWPRLRPQDGEGVRRSWAEGFAVACSCGLALLAFGRTLDANLAGLGTGWVGVLGLAVAMAGGWGVALRKEISHAAPWLALGVTGLGIYLGTAGGEGSARAAWNMGLMGMLVVSVLINTGPFARWERRLIWLVTFIFAGLPPFVGVSGTVRLGALLPGGGTIVGAALALLIYGLLTSAMLRRANRARQDWLGDEDLSRVFYAMGLTFPVLALFGFGLQVEAPISLPGILVSLAIVVVGFGVADLTLRYEILSRIEGWRMWIEMALVGASRLAGRLAVTARGVAGGAVGALEGEGAVIWLFVIVVFLFLVVGSGAM